MRKHGSPPVRIKPAKGEPQERCRLKNTGKADLAHPHEGSQTLSGLGREIGAVRVGTHVL